MIQIHRFSFALVVGTLIMATVSSVFGEKLAEGKAGTPQQKRDFAAASLSGEWQVSWQGRLGSEQCVLRLQQDGKTLTGTLKTLRGVSSVTGTVDQPADGKAGERVSFDVEFQGARPYTIRFTGDVVDETKWVGVSRASSVNSGGAYLGHAGEIVQPEHPWTATRAGNQISGSAERQSTSR